MNIDINADLKKVNELGLLDKLLIDKTTKNHIIWATDAYKEYGEQFSKDREIKASFLINYKIIKNRTEKDTDTQNSRTKKHAEVFTPSWICKKMNDYADEEWFGYPDAFTAEKVIFPKGKSWKDYVYSKRLEITCGEAPFLVSRYDAVTGEIIDIKDRIGILDRKIRVVSENTQTEEEWIRWVKKAFQSTYGYEFQGDNLIVARTNMLMSFFEYVKDRLDREPTKKEIREIINIINWNIWQMDGLTGMTPYKGNTETVEQFSFLPVEPQVSFFYPEELPEYCRIYDWRANRSVPFKTD